MLNIRHEEGIQVMLAVTWPVTQRKTFHVIK